MTAQKQRIFIGFLDIAGYYQSITKVLLEKGYKVTLFNTNLSTYNPDYLKTANHLWIMRLILLLQKQLNKSKHIIVFTFWQIFKEMLTLFLMFWAIGRHDVFIFSYGQSFILGGFDLWFLKKCGKRIISNIGYGSESRPSYMDGLYYNQKGHPISLSRIRIKTYFKKRKIKRIEKYSDVVINAPFTSQFNEYKFVNWFEIGIPVICNNYTVKSNENEAVQILHAPTNPFIKGTVFIRTAIKELKEKGYKINYIEITGMPHSKVLEELAACDFVVDQVFSDTLMASFPTEASCFGKASIVCGYELDKLKTHISEDMHPPAFTSHSDNIKDAIEYLIVNKEHRINLGKKAQNFVRNQWSVESVADRYIRLINNDIPDFWYLEHKNIQNVFGGGLTKDKSSKLIKQLIDKYGVSSLQLCHNPDLEKRFVEFANSEGND